MVAGRPSVRYQAVISLLALLMVSSMLASLNGFWKLESSQWNLFLMSAAAASLGWLWWRSPWTGVTVVLAGGGLVVVAMALGLMPAWSAYAQRVVLDIHNFIDNYRVNQLEASFGPALGMVFLSATGLFFGLVIVPESLSRGSTFWSIAGGTLVFGVEWAWYYDSAALHFFTYGIFAFLIWALGQAAVRDARWERAGRKVGYKSHVVTPVVWVLVVGIFAAMLPSNYDPLDLGSLGAKAQEAFPALKRLRGAGVGIGGGRFSLRSTGFNPSIGALGGPVKLDHSVALYLTADKPLTETAYLRGATFQVYDGRSWDAGKPEQLKLPDDGTLPSYWGSDVLRDYVKVRVKPAVNLGATIFTPWEPLIVNGLKSGYKADKDGNLWGNKSISKGTAYDVTSRWPRYSAEQIRKIGSEKPGEEFAPYLQLPAGMPARVGALAQAISAKGQTPYDKAVALEQYLRRFAYELDMNATPAGRDFVDYFLFDQKKGYCVYSASALTVLLRQVGIPSRLVEGFAVPTSAQFTEEQGGKYTYSVLNSQAHAWVEAYFAGYGWVTLDPTPRGDLPLPDRSTAAPQALDTSLRPNTGQTGSGSDVPANDGNNFNEGVNRTPEGAGGSGATKTASQWPWAVGALALIGGVLLLAQRRLKSQEQIAATEERQVVQEVWTKTNSLMQQFDAGPKPHQTPLEYAETLGKRWPSLKEPAEEVAQGYTQARYAPPERQLPDEAPKHARALWERLQEFLFDRYGWRTYFWKRLRWKYRSGSSGQG